MSQRAEAFDQSAGLRHAIAEAVLDALNDSDCTWHQAVGEVSFILAVLLADCEDEDERRAVARMLTTGLLEVARTGELPEAAAGDNAMSVVAAALILGQNTKPPAVGSDRGLKIVTYRSRPNRRVKGSSAAPFFAGMAGSVNRRLVP